MSAAFDQWAELHRQRLEALIDQHLPAADPAAARLFEAMRHVMQGGGKRIRPLLVHAACESCSGAAAAAELPALAVELIHGYSLVHDDLPAMDDDDLRRGRPTCHIAFDEASAILAGDALQSLAFELLATASQPSVELRMAMVLTLARAAGGAGMVGGQALDLAAEARHAQPLTLVELESLHQRKTGALLRASVRLGALAAGEQDALRLAALDRHAAALGLAFQIRDDILDVEGETALLGKRQGADAARGKVTYPRLLGMDAAKARAEALHQQALAALEPLGSRAWPLRALCEQLQQRSH